MIDIAWAEFFFIALLALILLGPKELPVVLRTLGKWIGRARALAYDCQLYIEGISSLDAATPSSTGSKPQNIPPSYEEEGEEAFDIEETASPQSQPEDHSAPSAQMKALHPWI